MDTLRGLNPINLKNNNKEITCQITDWLSTNEEIVEEEEETDNKKWKTYQDKKKYVIRAFGVTKKGNSVCINIHDFPPHYYVNIPDNYKKNDVDEFVKTLKNKLPKSFRNSITSYDIIKRKKFWGFTNNKMHLFIRLLFKNTQIMYQVTKLLKEPIRFKNYKPQIYEAYETNITPFLRFIHINNIFPCGWVRLEPGKYEIVEETNSTCQIDVDVFWKHLKPHECQDMSPFITASYDIEADSSHGDFPLAKKNYKKLSGELLDAYQKNQKKNKFLSVKERREYIVELLKCGFEENADHFDISFVFTKGGIKPQLNIMKILSKKIVKILDTNETYKILASDILDNLKSDQFDDEYIKELIQDAYSVKDEHKTSLSIRKIYTRSSKFPTRTAIKTVVDKVTILYEKLYEVLKEVDYKDKFVRYYIESNSISKLDEKIEYIFKKTEIDKDEIKLYFSRIESFINQITGIFNEFLPEIDKSRDTYVKRLTKISDELLPDIKGDKVIQIGTVVQKYGAKDFFLKHIITLDTCSDIDDAVVVQCETESDVLIEWAKFIRNLDPDIITGYNIFGFDFKYMFERAEELGIVEEFAYLGRLKNVISELECKKLASSALGDNNLIYITMYGRVQMDLFKIIQRDHNLVSYKLDYVAETFINDNITDIDKNILTIKGAITLNIGNYIVINYGNDDKYMKGKKFKIKNIIDDKIELYENIDESIKDNRPTWMLAKDDVSPQDIFRLQKGNADDRRIVAVYCVMDCALCLHIINKLDIITNNIGMSNVCYVPLSYIFMRGQGVKIFSLISKECRTNKYLIPVIKYKKEEVKLDRDEVNLKFEYDTDDIEVLDNDGGYEGAIVLKPQPGIYLDTPVSVLDYASLYPSSMISENLSHDSIILEDKYLGDEGIELLEKMGYGYVDITYDVYKWIDPKIKSKGKKKVGVKTCRFAQPNDGSKSLIPRVLQKLLKARKDTRKKIKTEPDPFKKAVLDGFQLAYKMTANSLYGQIGAPTSPICMIDIAASTTATGRKLLYLARDKVHEKFEGAEVVYGDSVPGNEPLLLMKDDKIIIKTIDSLNDNWENYDEFKPYETNRKEKQQTKTDYKIWSDGEWRKIIRVIKHKTKKKLFRINTHTGVVDVTEDHSLINDNRELIKPEECDLNTCIHSTYPNFNREKDLPFDELMKFVNKDIYTIELSVSEKKAFIEGMFYGDGSCGCYDTNYGKKNTWAINNQDLNLLTLCKCFLEDIYNIKFKILDTLNSSGVYKLVPIKNIKFMVNEFRSRFYHDKNKTLPDYILNSEYNIRKYFFVGYYCADGDRKSECKNIRISNKGKIGTSQLYYLMKSIGYNVSVNIRSDKMEIYRLTASHNSMRKKYNKIKKIIDLGYNNEDEYVYDIETENGWFGAGIGNMTLKNTDSIFVNYNPKDKDGNPLTGREGLKASIDLGVKSEEYIKDFLKPPHNLEYEKTFWPFILFSKKRYIGNKFEFDLDKYKQTSMGIVLKRRDNADILKHVYGGVMDIIMNEKNIKKSIKFLQEECRKLLDGKFPLDMLVITKSLRGFYKNPDQIAHKVLANRMGERDPGNKPSSNDRIPYVYIETYEKKGQKLLQGEKIENPAYIIEHELKPNYKFYITNQIMKPVGQIFALIVEKLDGYNKPKNYFENKFKSLKADRGELKAKNKISELRHTEASKILFDDILRVADNRKNKNFEITDFFKRM